MMRRMSSICTVWRRSGGRAARRARQAVWLALVLPLFSARAALGQTSPRWAAAIGPFSIETTRGAVEARLSRCDSNTLWVVREGATGAFEAGIPLAEIKRIVVPTPRIFAQIDQVTTAEAMRAAHESLDRLIHTLRPFRHVPGIPYHEALLHKARLYDRQGSWLDSIRLYEDLLKAPQDAPWKPLARWRAGVAYALSGNHERALVLLENQPLPDDEELLSSVMFSRGLARAALHRPRDALMDYLYLVVFHPYVQNNELRGLDAALGCYVELKDWESLLKTIQWIQKEYAGTPEARRAAELHAEYRAQLDQAAQFVDKDTAAPSSATAPVASDKSASAGEAATIEDVEVD